MYVIFRMCIVIFGWQCTCRNNLVFYLMNMYMFVKVYKIAHLLGQTTIVSTALQFSNITLDSLF